MGFLGLRRIRTETSQEADIVKGMRKISEI
jgi:hypothetical protein